MRRWTQPLPLPQPQERWATHTLLHAGRTYVASAATTSTVRIHGSRVRCPGRHLGPHLNPPPTQSPSHTGCDPATPPAGAAAPPCRPLPLPQARLLLQALPLPADAAAAAAAARPLPPRPQRRRGRASLGRLLRGASNRASRLPGRRRAAMQSSGCRGEDSVRTRGVQLLAPALGRQQRAEESGGQASPFWGCVLSSPFPPCPPSPQLCPSPVSSLALHPAASPLLLIRPALLHTPPSSLAPAPGARKAAARGASPPPPPR